MKHSKYITPSTKNFCTDYEPFELTAPEGDKYQIQGVTMLFDDSVIVKPVFVDFYIQDQVVKTVEYSDLSDWIKKSIDQTSSTIQGVTYHQFHINFAMDAVLVHENSSSEGFHKMVVRTDDGQLEGLVAKGEYQICVIDDKYV